jgi:hypothetical protein
VTSGDEWAGRDTVFLSYSRDDAEWSQAFQVMLDPLLEELGMQLWVDSDIRAGDRWNPEIEQVIAHSQVALLLVSSRFLYSDYIRRHELPALIAHGVRLAPVLVGTCGWSRVRELSGVQWLHDPGRDGALDLFSDRVGERDRRIWQACERLLALLPDLAGKGGRPATGGSAPSAHIVDVPIGSVVGQLSEVPPAPPGYVAREELTELISAVVEAESGAVGVTGTTFADLRIP